MRVRNVSFILSITLIFLALAGLGSADVTDEDLRDGILAYYKSDTDGSYPDAVGTNNGTIYGADYNSSGKINGAYDFVRTNTDYIDTNLALSGNSSYTVTFWARVPVEYTDQFLMNNIDWGSYTGGFAIMQRGGNGDIELGYARSGGWDLAGTDSYDINDGEWHFFLMYIDEGNIYLGIDNVTRISASTADIFPTPDTQSIIIGRMDIDDYLQGQIDEVGVWAGELNSSLKSELYDRQSNNKKGSQYDFTSAAAPTVNLVTPEDDTTYNTNQNFTFNLDTYNASNCSLYNNLSGSWQNNETLYNLNTSTNYTFSTTANIEGTYKWNVKCYGFDGTIGWGNNNRTFTIDKIDPNITLVTPIEAKYNPYLENLSIDILYEEENDLFAYEVNVSNSTGTQYYYDNASISGTSYNLVDTLDISGYPLGNYDFLTRASDSHTKNKIKKYNPKTGTDWLEYNTAEGNEVIIKAQGAKRANTRKHKDRYDFQFSYDDNERKKATYHIKSDKKIWYRPHTGYKAHFVVYNPKTKEGNWIDFEGDGFEDYSVHKISDTHYKVTGYLTGREVTFNSIGGLNFQTETENFEITSTVEFNLTDNLDGSGIPYTISFNGETTDINAGDIPQFENVSAGEYKVSLTGAQIVDESFNVTINDSYHMFHKQVARSKTLFLNIFDELTQEPINETLTVSIKGEQDLTYTTSASYINLGNLSNGEYLFQILNENYTRRAYFVDIDNNTQSNLTAYLLSNFETSALIIDYIYRDSSQERIEDARITYFRQIEGEYQIIHQDDTDYAGQLRLSQDTLTEYKVHFTHPTYGTKTFFLRPIQTQYNIQVITNATDYGDTVFDGIKYNYFPKVESLNTSGWTYINFSLTSDYNDLDYFGMKLDEHNYTCEPVSCEATNTNPGGGSVSIKIKLNDTGSFERNLYFKRSGFPKQYLNHDTISVIDILVGPGNVWAAVAEMKQEIGVVALGIIGVGITLALVGTAAELGIFGLGLAVIAVLGNIAAGLLGFYSLWVALLTAVFGLGIYFLLGE